jgi:hypothetical protein
MSKKADRGNDPEADIQLVIGRLVSALKRLEGYNPDLDLPLIEEVARSAAFIKRGETYLNRKNCSPETYAGISDGMAKHASRMRQAMKELAVTRAERMRCQSATAFAAELKAAVDRVIRQEDKHDS